MCHAWQMPTFAASSWSTAVIFGTKHRSVKKKRKNIEVSMVYNASGSNVSRLTDADFCRIQLIYRSDLRDQTPQC